MSRFTLLSFAAGIACLALALILHEPSPNSEISPQPRNSFEPTPRARVPLTAVVPRQARVAAIPLSYQSRRSSASYPRSSSPLPRWTPPRRALNSEDLLEAALRELALEVAQLKQERQAPLQREIVPAEEILEEIVFEQETPDPLAHLPAIRRRRDIDAGGTAFTPFGFRPFKTDWTDFAFRQFRPPGLI